MIYQAPMKHGLGREITESTSPCQAWGLENKIRYHFNVMMIEAPCSKYRVFVRWKRKDGTTRKFFHSTFDYDRPDMCAASSCQIQHYPVKRLRKSDPNRNDGGFLKALKYVRHQQNYAGITWAVINNSAVNTLPFA